MPLREQRVSANDVRVPAMEEGMVIVVSRYSHDRPKAVILHPSDYALLRDTAAIVDGIERPTGFTDAALAAREAEDRPRADRLVEDSAQVAELLGL